MCVCVCVCVGISSIYSIIFSGFSGIFKKFDKRESPKATGIFSTFFFFFFFVCVWR